MKLNVGERIRKFRRERDITQDELAQAVGITSQSVSKWERGDGYPDIELLPPLARFFGVTVDELLGNDRTDEIIDGYMKKSNTYRTNGDRAADLELWEKAYAEFPDDLRVIEMLAVSLGNGKNPDEDNKRVVSLCEQILGRSTNQPQRELAIQMLCYTYADMGELEKSLHYADMSGIRDELRCAVLMGDEGVEACQYYLADLINHVYIIATRMTFKKKFPPKEAIEIFKFIIDVFKLLYSDDNVLFCSCYLTELYYRIAKEYAEMKDSENTVAALKDSMKYAIVNATLPEEGD